MGPSYYLLGYHFVFFLNPKRLDEMIPQALCGDVMFYNLSTSRDGLILSPMSHFFCLGNPPLDRHLPATSFSFPLLALYQSRFMLLFKSGNWARGSRAVALA